MKRFYLKIANRYNSIQNRTMHLKHICMTLVHFAEKVHTIAAVDKNTSNGIEVSLQHINYRHRYFIGLSYRESNCCSSLFVIRIVVSVMAICVHLSFCAVCVCATKIHVAARTCIRSSGNFNLQTLKLKLRDLTAISHVI